nr:hypothetical protein [Tanacetum cinerariifolium]
MDIFTKRALWDYWKTGSNETEPTNEKFPNLKNEYWNDEDETTKIFKIETNIFDYESHLCMEFSKFNYLLEVDPELFTYDIKRTENYDDYMNEFIDEFKEPWDEGGVPYEIRDHICEPFRFKNGRTKWPNCISIKIYSAMVENNQECDFLDMLEHEEEERSKVFDNHERRVCNIWRFEMIKNSFGDDEEYVAIKENEYDDLTNTSKEAIHAYQEIFRMIDEG